MFGVLVISNCVAVWQGFSSKGFDTHVAVKPRYFFWSFLERTVILNNTNNERTKKDTKIISVQVPYQSMMQFMVIDVFPVCLFCLLQYFNQVSLGCIQILNFCCTDSLKTQTKKNKKSQNPNWAIPSPLCNPIPNPNLYKCRTFGESLGLACPCARVQVWWAEITCPLSFCCSFTGWWQEHRKCPWSPHLYIKCVCK